MKERVLVKFGKTINIGNYESIRIDVGIEKDISSDRRDEIEALLEECKDIIENEESCINNNLE